MKLAGNIVTADATGYGEISWENGKIKSVVLSGDPRDDAEWILPGFIDVHIHGAGPFTVEAGAAGVEGMARFLAAKGVVRFLPTYSSAPHDEIVAWLHAVRPLVGRANAGARIEGFHLEGPWLNVRYAGGMIPGEIRPASIPAAAEFLDAASGALKLLTLAPEMPGALDVVRFLTAHRVKVSMGHTECPPGFLDEAVASGVGEATHLFDSYPLPEDHGGVRQAALTDMLLIDDRVMKEIIMDGLHVPPALVKLARRAAGSDRIIAITDALQGAGLPEGRFLDCGKPYLIRDGELAKRIEDGQIVGSSLTMNRAFFNMVTKFGFTPVEAARAASSNPAKQLGIADRTGRLAPDFAADVTVLAPDRLTVRATYGDGRPLYRNDSHV